VPGEHHAEQGKFALGVREVGRRRNDDFARNRHERAFQRHQARDQPVAALAPGRIDTSPKTGAVGPVNRYSLRIEHHLGIGARGRGIALALRTRRLRAYWRAAAHLPASHRRRDPRAPRSRQHRGIAVGERHADKSAWPPASALVKCRRANSIGHLVGARDELWAAARRHAQALGDRIPGLARVRRLTASAAAAAASSAPRCFFQAATTGAHRLQRLLLRQLVIGGAQHHAAPFLHLDDRAQASIEHVLAEGSLDDRGRLAEIAAAVGAAEVRGLSCTVRPALRATTSMSVAFCRAASASWSCALLNSARPRCGDIRFPDRPCSARRSLTVAGWMPSSLRM
jgi:hypothetical protein